MLVFAVRFEAQIPSPGPLLSSLGPRNEKCFFWVVVEERVRKMRMQLKQPNARDARLLQPCLGSPHGGGGLKSISLGPFTVQGPGKPSGFPILIAPPLSKTAAL